MKQRIAFVVTGYGKEINGGTEQHCRMLAERMIADYDVEVLTTCVKDYARGGNVLPAGEESVNGVLVRRFVAEPVQPELHEHYSRQSRWIRRIRKHLYQLGLLQNLANLHPIWTSMQQREELVMKSYVFYSPALITFLQQHQDNYKAILPINISYPVAYYAALCAPAKTILIPTMHYESSAFRAIYSRVFTTVAYIGFNTTAEQRLAEHIFGCRQIAPHGIISVGIDEAVDAGWEETKHKYGLPDEYLLYVGRVDKGKLQHILPYFLNYKQKYPDSRLKLVLVGGFFTTPEQYPDVCYTGFVSEAEKYILIQHAMVFVNPSKFESLSLILLEGMSRGKAMLVNGRCAVLKEHCVRSHGAAVYYRNRREFIARLHCLESSAALREEMGMKGRQYVAEHYNWELILKRLKQVIANV